MSAAAIYPRLFAKLFCSPIMLHQPVRATFEQALIQRMFGGGEASLAAAPAPKAADTSQLQYRTQRVFRQVGNVGIVTIDGVIDKRISDFDLDCYGGCDLADVDTALSICAADEGITKVLLDVNSPGGSVTGVAETAARIAALRESKPVHAFVNVQCCSAGYFIASQAQRIAAAPSAVIGSIGVYMAILDATRAIEMDGYRVQMIKSGRYKGMGAPWNPLTDEERQMLQDQCDAIHSEFKSACTALRPKLADSTMQGQWFDGRQADDLYLVDELTAETPDEYLSRFMLAKH